MTVEVSEKEIQNSSADYLKKIAKKDQDSVKNLSVKLDDNEVNDIHSYRTPTDVFQLEFPSDPLLTSRQVPAKL